MRSTAAPRHNTMANGFTLIEMLITVLILGVLLLVAVPGFFDLIQNNRILSEVYSLRATTNTARTEAITRRSPVTICSSNDGLTCSGGWTDGYIVFLDTDSDGVVDAGEEIFIVKDQDVDSLNITFSNANNRITFDSRGNARNSSGTFTICDERGALFARGLIVNAVGSVRAAVDETDSALDDSLDDIMNDDAGNNLACP
jgi:type IV fimbrial biogenesis protein FimT